MSIHKTFRLFISSTFSDFKKEREVLQTKVFPYIKKYCSKKGYIFQPIDLRWGVSNEAQLDQKTLELCLNEVRSCKTHLHPNFLIMAGDRYGWVPLPYIIEKDEFETILSLADTKGKKELLYWYLEDLNQLPTSYILKERSGDFKDSKIWEDIEIELSNILQETVNNSNLTDIQKRKYFFSATEAEVEEGIIPYIQPTSFQEILIEKDSTLLEIDSKHIFGFFRDIDKNSKKSDKFITADYDKAQKFKSAVKKELLKDNILEINTIQNNEDSLDEEYLKEFESSTIKFLEKIFDSHIYEEKNFTPLEIEQSAQSQFTSQKCQDFIGQEKSLQIINNYINNDNQQPLIIYGSSGIGKSSLMAKAIEIEKSSQRKVIYRFVGATSNSSSSTQVLTFIFEELGINIRNEQESFEKFSERVYMEIMDLKDEVTIFIDAIDQIGHDNQCLWLPQTLPNNIKIIISTLDDEKYQDNSKYFQILKEKSSNIHKVEAFQEPKKLLYALLKKEQRTIQLHQEEYFLQQYKTSSSPLYINIVVQELKNWKSYDLVENQEYIKNRKIQTLANNQKGIIKNFVSNFYKLYHHNKPFVQKVLGYLYASRDGLSESELFQLLATDEEFIKSMSPEDYHDNSTKELPLVHWSRLHTQLKPFLSQKSLDGEELMYFFHREFGDVVVKQENQQIEHENIIKATQILIEENQDNDFYSNRWGRLYSTLITEYHLLYKVKHKQKKFSEFIANIANREWCDMYIDNILSIGQDYSSYNRMINAITFRESFLYTMEPLYIKDPIYWVENYTTSLNDLAVSYSNQDRLDEAIKLQEKSLNIREVLYKKDSTLWAADYSSVLSNLSVYYYYKNIINKAIILQEKCLDIREELYSINRNLWAEDYTNSLNSLANFYLEIQELDTAIKFQKRNLHICEEFYKIKPDTWAGKYTSSLHNLSIYYKKNSQLDKALEYQNISFSIRKMLYEKNPNLWVEKYSDSINDLAILYRNINRLSDAITLQNENLSILEVLYKKDSNRWASKYTNLLNNLAISHKYNAELDEAIKVQEKSLNISTIYYKKDSNRWVKRYMHSLNNLAIYYKNNTQLDEAIKLQEKKLNICTTLYEENNNYWVEDYTDSLNNLANSYLNKNLLDKAQMLQEKSLSIREVFYKKDSNRWVEKYTNSLNNLARIYKKNNRLDDAISLEEKSLNIYKALYKNKSNVWGENYANLLGNLAISYYSKNLVDKSIILKKDSLNIFEMLYKTNNSRWAIDYSNTLYSLANFYYNEGLFNEAIVLLEKQYSVSVKLNGVEHKKSKEILSGIQIAKNHTLE